MINQKHNQKLYEDFHHTTSRHSRIVDPTDYTQGPILQLANQYASKSKTVLDIGCGTAAKSFYLASQGKKVTGIDISQKAIDSCLQNAKAFNLQKNTNFINQTLEDYKTSKNFDLILCTEVIEHIQDDQKMLKKIFTLLNKNGILILTTPSQNAPLYRIGFLNQFDQRVGHLRRYNLKPLTKLLQKSGFSIITTQKSEGIVRNFIFTSSIGGKVILRLINRSNLLKQIAIILDTVSLKIFKESDLIVVCTKS